jgi:hypothetical protein
VISDMYEHPFFSIQYRTQQRRVFRKILGLFVGVITDHTSKDKLVTIQRHACSPDEEKKHLGRHHPEIWDTVMGTKRLLSEG